MSNLRRMVKVMGDMVETAEKNGAKIGMAVKDEDVILRTMNGDALTVATVKGAVEEMDDGEFKIGNAAYRIRNAPKSHPHHKICALCAFSDKFGRSQRSCPRLTFFNYNRALCTFVGTDDRAYFELIG